MINKFRHRKDDKEEAAEGTEPAEEKKSFRDKMSLSSAKSMFKRDKEDEDTAPKEVTVTETTEVTVTEEEPEPEKKRKGIKGMFKRDKDKEDEDTAPKEVTVTDTTEVTESDTKEATVTDTTEVTVTEEEPEPEKKRKGFKGVMSSGMGKMSAGLDKMGDVKDKMGDVKDKMGDGMGKMKDLTEKIPGKDLLANMKKDGDESNTTTLKVAPTICTMKPGDYMIHIFVEEAKNIKMKEGSTVDPLVQLAVLGEHKYSRALKGIDATQSAKWNQHIFFEPKNLTTNQLAKGTIEIKLVDKGFFKDAMLGYFEFDLTQIYQMEDHALQHMYLVMNNPEAQDFSDVSAYLKISIAITGSADKQIEIKTDPNPSQESFLQPPTITPEFYQIYVRFLNAQQITPNFNPLLRKGRIDAYVKLEYRTRKLKTKTLEQKEGGEIHWNEEFLVPAQVPVIGGTLKFFVYDEQTIKDEVCSSFTLDAKKIINGDYPNFFWQNIYGAPVGCSGNNSDAMNLDPEIASLWKGRILIQVAAVKTDKPKLKMQDITDNVLLEESQKFSQPRQYTIACQALAAICLPDPGMYKLEVCIAENSFITTDQPITEEKSLYNRWNEDITSNAPIFMGPYRKIENFGFVFVYLQKKCIGKWKRVSFYRGDIEKFLVKDAGIVWLQMSPDLSIGQVEQQNEAGIVGLRLSLHDVGNNGPINWQDYPNWAAKMKKRPHVFNVRAFVFQARDLPACDENGTSDPFVRITDCSTPKDSSVIFDSVNPIFFQTLELAYEAFSKEDMPPIVLDLFDMDVKSIGKNEVDFISRAVLRLSDIEPYSEGDGVPTPRWYPLRFKLDGPKSGEILLSFAIMDSGQMFNTPASQVNIAREAGIDMAEYQFTLNILGLRNLQSAGVLPVRKANILFNLKSMVSPEVGNAVDNMKTEPGPPGPNPTLNTLIEFVISLPTDKLYCPTLACTVFDNVMFGGSQPHLGTFTIPIGDIIIDIAQQREAEMNALQETVDTLKKYAKGEQLVLSFRANLKKINNLSSMMDSDESALSRSVHERQSEYAAKKSFINSANAAAINDSFSLGSVDQSYRLLSVDSSEEQRMAQRVAERDSNAVNGQQRMTKNQIAAAAASVGAVTQTRRDVNQSFRSNEVQQLMEDPSVKPMIDKTDPRLKAQLLAQNQEAYEKQKRDTDDAQIEAEALSGFTKFIQMPAYARDTKLNVDREVNPPSDKLFLGLGWDANSTTNRRHYRRFYTQELETIKELMPKETPFDQYDLKHGQTRGAKKSIWDKLKKNQKQDASGQVDTTQIMGRFKAVITVELKNSIVPYKARKRELIKQMIANLRELAHYRGIETFELDMKELATYEGRRAIKKMMEPLGVNHLPIVKTLTDINSDLLLQHQLLHSKKCVVRVYCISGFDFASRDAGGSSDPYLIVQIGDHVFNEKKNYQIDQTSPVFCKVYDVKATFPGCPMLEIRAMDHDMLFGDELIGNVFVDLEDRYFLPSWNAINDKPIEYRGLHHPSSSVAQGTLKMWIEINDPTVPKEKQPKLWDISEKPAETFEVRVCIFDAKDVKMLDGADTFDAFFRVHLDSEKDSLETDTHFRCQDGQPAWNYRLLYKLHHPCSNYTLSLQCMDRDFFSPNKIIGSNTIDLRKAIEDCSLTNRPLPISKDYYNNYMLKKDKSNVLKWHDDSENMFYMPLLAKNKKGIIQSCGECCFQIDVVPIEYAKKNKLGSARDDPNINPNLPVPPGRISFTVNPIKLFAQMVGPAMRRKIYCYVCLILTVGMCLYMIPLVAPVIAGNVIANIF